MKYFIALTVALVMTASCSVVFIEKVKEDFENQEDKFKNDLDKIFVEWEYVC